jgi:adenylosuccinate synthase
MSINFVDICCGLAWGDEAKGKIVSELSKSKKYDFICRWAGGNNAGHTVYVNDKKYKTHLIPCGIFYGIKSIIGPDCVINIDSFFKEIEYLNENGFDTNLIKISPKAHIITENHINDDNKNYKLQLGTTVSGIAPCYRDKYARIGKRVLDYKDILESYIWDEELYGNILCEGAQGFWLDINYGNYPYITSSNTLPYSACSLGIPPQLIRNIYGAAKIYDTRVGLDPDFSEELFNDKDLSKIAINGDEYGVKTGRKRKVNWLNVDKLIKAINISGVTHLIISKIDILENTNMYKFYYNNELSVFDDIISLKNKLTEIINNNCVLLKNIKFSDNPKYI